MHACCGHHAAAQEWCVYIDRYFYVQTLPVSDGLYFAACTPIRLAWIPGSHQGPNDKGLSRKHIIEGTQAALKRLRVDYVDLIFCHRPDVSTPIEETVRAMNFVIEKVRARRPCLRHLLVFLVCVTSSCAMACVASYCACVTFWRPL